MNHPSSAKRGHGNAALRHWLRWYLVSSAGDHDKWSLFVFWKQVSKNMLAIAERHGIRIPRSMRRLYP